MSDDYLWDRRGPRTPRSRGSSALLGRLRTEPPMPDWNRVAPRAGGVRHFSATYLAAAAALVVACGASLWLARGAAGTAAPSWAVVRVDGPAGRRRRQVVEAGRLPVGAWLRDRSSPRAPASPSPTSAGSTSSPGRACSCSARATATIASRSSAARSTR